MGLLSGGGGNPFDDKGLSGLWNDPPSVGRPSALETLVARRNMGGGQPMMGQSPSLYGMLFGGGRNLSAPSFGQMTLSPEVMAARNMEQDMIERRRMMNKQAEQQQNQFWANLGMNYLKSAAGAMGG